MTESFLASATRALPGPDRLAIACAQSFKLETFFSRVRTTPAASYIKVRASVSPHFDIRPLRSTSPDGIVTLLNNMHTNLMGRRPSRDRDGFIQCLHGRGSEGTVRLG
jgi:hypothetical protein